MTNWCSNGLEITGKRQELDKQGTLLATGDGKFDFNVFRQSPTNWIFTATLALRNRLAQSTQETGSGYVALDPLPNQGCGSCQRASSLTRIIGAIIFTPALNLEGVFPLFTSEVKYGKYCFG